VSRPASIRRPPLLSFLVAVFATAGGLSAQGKLDQVHDSVHDGDDDQEDPFDDDDWDDDEASDLELLIGDPIGTAVEYTLFLPFYVPRIALGDETLDRAEFQDHPYDDGPGFWFEPEGAFSEHDLSVRLALEYGSDFDDIERTGFALQLEHANRFGLEATWNRWHEDLDSGGTDELDLGDVNVVYRFAQSAKAAWRAGAGLNFLHDEIDSDLGANFTYGAEFFPKEPLSLGFELDLGTLGDATETHFRGRLGFLIHEFELYASFDHFDIDDEELHSYGLGLRGWF